MDNILGTRLKELREEMNKTQKDIAKVFGITNFQLSRYESGQSNPDPDLIKKFAEYYDVSTDYLLGLTNLKNYQVFENAGITNEEYENLSAYQKEVVDFFLTRENLHFYDRPKRLLDALEQFEIFYEYWKKQQEQKDEE